MMSLRGAARRTSASTRGNVTSSLYTGMMISERTASPGGLVGSFPVRRSHAPHAVRADEIGELARALLLVPAQERREIILPVAAMPAGSPIRAHPSCVRPPAQGRGIDPEHLAGFAQREPRGHTAAGQSAHHVVASLTTTMDTGRPVASRNPANISPAATSSATGSSPPEPSRARVLTSASDRPPAAIRRLPITRPGTISFRQSNQDEYSAPPIRVKVP